MRCFPLIFLAFSLSLVACKQPPPVQTPTEPAAPPATAAPATLPPPASPTAAPLAILPVMTGGAHFQFSLKESPDALKLQTTRCEAEAKGDAAKAAACMAEVEKEAATEGIRFEQDEGRLVWVSYGAEKDGTEKIFLRGQVYLLDSPADEMHFRPSAGFTGEQAGDAQFASFPKEKFLTLKLVNATTVVMQGPPPKGALLYHRQ